VSGRTATWNGPQLDILSLERASYTYDVSVWTKLGGAASASSSLTAQVTCTGQPTQFIPLAQATASDGDWSLLSGELSLPKRPLQARAVYVEGPTPEVDIYGPAVPR